MLRFQQVHSAHFSPPENRWPDLITWAPCTLLRLEGMFGWLDPADSWLGWWWAGHLQTLQAGSQTSALHTQRLGIAGWAVHTAVTLKKSFGGCLICNARGLLSRRGYRRAASDASHSSSTSPWHNLKAETSPFTWGTNSNRGTTAMKRWVFPRVKHAQRLHMGKKVTFLLLWIASNQNNM